MLIYTLPQAIYFVSCRFICMFPFIVQQVKPEPIDSCFGVMCDSNELTARSDSTLLHRFLLYDRITAMLIFSTTALPRVWGSAVEITLILGDISIFFVAFATPMFVTVFNEWLSTARQSEHRISRNLATFLCFILMVMYWLGHHPRKGHQEAEPDSRYKYS